MQNVLERLSHEPWVRGSMIVSTEGMVVMDNVSAEIDRDAVSALASDLVTETTAALDEAEMPTFTRIVLTATAGELVVVGCGSVYLIVIAASGSEAFYIEIDSAARNLRRLAPTASLRDL